MFRDPGVLLPDLCRARRSPLDCSNAWSHVLLGDHGNPLTDEASVVYALDPPRFSEGNVHQLRPLRPNGLSGVLLGPLTGYGVEFSGLFSDPSRSKGVRGHDQVQVGVLDLAVPGVEVPSTCDPDLIGGRDPAAKLVGERLFLRSGHAQGKSDIQLHGKHRIYPSAVALDGQPQRCWIGDQVGRGPWGRIHGQPDDLPVPSLRPVVELTDLAGGTIGGGGGGRPPLGPLDDREAQVKEGG